MTRVIIIYDRLNRRWLQNAEEPYEVAWTDTEAQCSFYEPERLTDLLKMIEQQSENEVWVQVIEMYINSL